MVLPCYSRGISVLRVHVRFVLHELVWRQKEYQSYKNAKARLNNPVCSYIVSCGLIFHFSISMN